MSSTKRLAHQVSATPSPRSSRMEEVAQRGSFSMSDASSGFSDNSAVAVPATATSAPTTPTDGGMLRTTEILWNGVASLGFTLKRKRKTGAILVSKLKENQHQLRVGSELKLVGGFPVKQLTLAEVKKVMLMAPKPVSLVFLNKDDALVQMQQTMQLVAAADTGGLSHREASASFITDCSDDRGSFNNEFVADTAAVAAAPVSATGTAARAFLFPAQQEKTDAYASRPSLQRSASAFTMTTPAALLHHPLSPSSSSSGYTTYTNYYAKPSDHKAKKRKVSKLRVALDRMSQLLNRPVRQSALNIPAGKSIMV